MKLKIFLKENILILIIISISLILHIMALKELNFNYSLNSDDISYLKSGIHFLENGEIIMHGYLSAQIMPGMTYLIALFALLFGKGMMLWISLKILWLIMGCLSIYGVYKTVTLFTPKIYGCIASIFLLAVDFIWMDNLILTETPFMVSFIFLIYNTFALIKTNKNKYFFYIVICYLIALLFKANIAPYPLFLFFYYIWKKYDFKLLMKQMVLAGVIISIFLIPWTIRNYNLFDSFIPLTYGVGNPLLLGTYQGYNYPKENIQLYKKHSDKVMNDEMKYYINNNYDDVEKKHMKKYYSLKNDEIIAKYRMKQWWNNDKVNMLKSYLIYKPMILIRNSFYWDEIFGIPKSFNILLRNFDIILTLVSITFILKYKKHIKESLFLLSIYLFQIYVYSYTFAFERYGQTLYFIRFIIIGFGLSIMVPRVIDFIKKLNFKFK